MRHSGAIRNFESTLRALASRGHTIHLTFVIRDKIGDDRMAVGGESIVTRLTDDLPQITYGVLPKRSDSHWFGFARALRFLADSLRYRLPAYRDAHSLRLRAEVRIPWLLRPFVRAPWVGWGWFNRLASGFLGLIDRALPIEPLIEDDVRSFGPDVLLVTPLLDLGSDQVDYIKAARRHGIPSALCVHSWDNLTNKGVIRIKPDRIFVWNEAQRQEAIEHHHVRPVSVVATGAHTYDHWFDWEPSRQDEEFKKLVGLHTTVPYVLYLGSSRFIAPNEIDFVERWLAQIRRAENPSVLREVGVLIRPHPENPQPWERLQEPGFGNFTVWPPHGANPVFDELRADYFDSIFHSRAIVGINTSGMIEAGIVGRPTLTILDPSTAPTQQGTLHFRLLTGVGGGLLQVAESFDQHFDQMETVLQAGSDSMNTEFIHQFVRPHGAQARGTDRLVEGIEGLRKLPKPRPVGSGFWVYPIRALCYPVAAAMSRGQDLARMARSGLRALVVGPRKLALQLLNRFLRIRRVRGFVNKYVVPRVLSGDRVYPENAMVQRDMRLIARRSRGRIVVGPWTGEVGFELLYWIPFLRWAKSFGQLDPERLVVLSRGGVGDWYTSITENYVEVLDYMNAEHYLKGNLRRVITGKQKQRKMTPFDTELVRVAKDVLKDNDLEVLHPSVMFNLFMPYWKGQASHRLLDQFSEFRAFELPQPVPVAGLAPDYVAVRFYFNDSFPDTKENRSFAAGVVERLADHRDVLVLNPSQPMDEHHDFDPSAHPRVKRIDDLTQPADNLAVQSALIAGAAAFIGTYGGLSYLPPLYGVPSVAFYSAPEGFHRHHLEFAQHAFAALEGGSFIALDVLDAELLETTFASSSLAVGHGV